MKIAIVGTAANTVNLAPYNDDSWQIWSLGKNYADIPRFDVWFELHSLEQLRRVGAEAKHFDHLKEIEERLIIMNSEAELPKARLFPVDDVVKDVGSYITSSVSWMVALAINLKAEEIGIWGVNMSSPEEYIRQKASCESLLKVAQDRGIKITLPDGCPLLKGAIYPNDIIFDLENREKAAQRDCQKHRDEMHRYQGMKEILYELRMFYG